MSLPLNIEEKDSFPRTSTGAEPLNGTDSRPSYDLDRALIETVEEMKFDWPECLPVERIKAGIVEIALGLLLFAALLAFCGFR